MLALLSFALGSTVPVAEPTCSIGEAIERASTLDPDAALEVLERGLAREGMCTQGDLRLFEVLETSLMASASSTKRVERALRVAELSRMFCDGGAFWSILGGILELEAAEIVVGVLPELDGPSRFAIRRRVSSWGPPPVPDLHADAAMLRSSTASDWTYAPFTWMCTGAAARVADEVTPLLSLPEDQRLAALQGWVTANPPDDETTWPWSLRDRCGDTTGPALLQWNHDRRATDAHWRAVMGH